MSEISIELDNFKYNKNVTTINLRETKPETNSCDVTLVENAQITNVHTCMCMCVAKASVSVQCECNSVQETVLYESKALNLSNLPSNQVHCLLVNIINALCYYYTHTHTHTFARAHALYMHVTVRFTMKFIFYYTLHFPRYWLPLINRQ